MPEATGGASLFHPLTSSWFAEVMGEPTEVQRRAWPVIAGGSHVLVSAPTGTGKTLAAFLWGIDRLATGAWPTGKTRILYVSPLKALNADIQRNLLSPLGELEARFHAAGVPFPRIRALTRSGDTPAGDRRRMLADPPEILITTPESLNLILSSPNGRLMLDGLQTVILDEIHAVAGTKRGTHLVTAVERLVRLAGEFQRIALSATVKPLSVVADFVGGYRVERDGGRGGTGGAGAAAATAYVKRSVEVVHCPHAKSYEIVISFPGGTPEQPMWDALAAECRAIIRSGRSTLFFVNSRRHAEKLSRLINEGEAETLAWSHHGSLSRELRLVVEERLKRGELKAIVATSSLELGIDIGALDRVVLVQTPFSVASAVQRMGRAGHGVGQASRAVIFPLHGRDIVDAAVTASCVREQDIESIEPVICPLDVLAQLIVSMTSVETWSVEELYDEIRASAPFHTLPRRHFDLVLAMLAGRYEETRLRELSPLVSVDRIEGTVLAREGARLRLATSGGTIPDRGYFSLRTADTKALLGELDEEFVWERSVGDSFILGTQAWRIQAIGHQDVEVVPVSTRSAMSPFWKAEERNRGFHLSQRIARALEDWNGRVGAPGFVDELAEAYGLEPGAAKALASFLARQKEATGADLPHRHHLLVEHARDLAPGGGGETAAGYRIALHTLWGGRVNRPFSLALSAAWEERFGRRPECFQTDDTILLIDAADHGAAEILGLVRPENVERLLRKRLEGSGFFGARFRENAARALLLPRASIKRRMPLWLTRLRAKALYAAASKYDDFPLLIETWRTCLRDEFDMENLSMLLGEVSDGTIRIGEASTSTLSPFCGNIAWKQSSSLMYADDAPGGDGRTALRGDLVRELALSAQHRPRIPREVASEFQAKLQRTAEGYAPRDSREMLDWLKERVLLPQDEWDALLAACERDGGARREEIEAGIAGKHTAGEVVAARETLPRLRRCLEAGNDEELTDLIAQWLRFYGPVEPSFVGKVFGLPEQRLAAVLRDLVEEESLVVDRLIEGSEAVLACDRENLERLLRISRAARTQAALPTLPVDRLPLFVAAQQGLVERGSTVEELKRGLETLFGLALPARLWEEEVLPARLSGYQPRGLDQLMRESGLLWFASGKRRIGFCLREDAELFLEPAAGSEQARCDAIFPGKTGKFGFWDLVRGSSTGTAALADELWRLAWKGVVSNDSFQPVRRGIATGFRAEPAVVEGGRRRRSLDRWQASRPAEGYWFRLEAGSGGKDALEEEETNRDRIRQVLRRFGVVFREILENELPLLRWSRLFRSLRLMEFSGEVVAGRFFTGIQGLQFASPAALEGLAGLAGTSALDEAVYWMSAADPASLAGVGLEGLKGSLPPRLPTTHIVFRGGAPVLVSRRNGLDLDFRIPADDPMIPRCLEFVRVLTEREAAPLRSVHVETVNGEPAARSPYAPAMLAFGFVADYKRLTFRGGFSASP